MLSRVEIGSFVFSLCTNSFFFAWHELSRIPNLGDGDGDGDGERALEVTGRDSNELTHELIVFRCDGTGIVRDADCDRLGLPVASHSIGYQPTTLSPSHIQLIRRLSNRCHVQVKPLYCVINPIQAIQIKLKRVLLRTCPHGSTILILTLFSTKATTNRDKLFGDGVV